MREKITFQEYDGLIPVVIQEKNTGDVLMLGYMNKGALEKTIIEGYVYFWSRKRNKLWMKGKTSGNKLKVKEILLDCDGDALLIQTKIIGNGVCHQGYKSCFKMVQM